MYKGGKYSVGYQPVLGCCIDCRQDLVMSYEVRDDDEYKGHYHYYQTIRCLCLLTIWKSDPLVRLSRRKATLQTNESWTR